METYKMGDCCDAMRQNFNKKTNDYSFVLVRFLFKISCQLKINLSYIHKFLMFFDIVGENLTEPPQTFESQYLLAIADSMP